MYMVHWMHNLLRAREQKKAPYTIVGLPSTSNSNETKQYRQSPYSNHQHVNSSPHSPQQLENQQVDNCCVASTAPANNKEQKPTKTEHTGEDNKND